MIPFKIKTPKGLRQIGPGHPVFIIAEMSANHGHNIKKAYKIIDAAVSENYPTPSLSKIAIKKDSKKMTISPEAINFSHKYPFLKSAHAPLLPFDEKDFYLIFREKHNNRLSKQYLKQLKKDGKQKVIYADQCLLTLEELEEHNIQFKQIPYEV